MNLIDIEAYTKTTIPTMPISNELLSKPNPPVKMKEGRIKPSGKAGGKPGGRRPPRSGSRPGSGAGNSRGPSRRRQHS
jgi:hypothetical protein